MNWWIYKCNSKNNSYQGQYGDWEDYFRDPTRHWGSTEWIPALEKLQKGDLIIAYQTDRNELVGIVKVRQSSEQDNFVYLEVVEKFINPAKVRPLRKSNPQIASIPAFQPGLIQTIYEISLSDVQELLKFAGFAFEALQQRSQCIF